MASLRDLCNEYVDLIKTIEEMGNLPLDEHRANLHNLICEELGLNKEDTKIVTDNIDLRWSGKRLYRELMKLKSE